MKIALDAMDLRRLPIDQVKGWKDNPRQIKKGDYERLKKQIQELGFYKPLIATSDGNGAFTVIGGNMRLRALKELGALEVQVSIVNAPTDELKLKYTLSDNDRAGSWDDQALAELTTLQKDALGDLEMFKIDIGQPVKLDRLLDEYGPGTSSTEDHVPEPQPQAISRPGDLYTLGRHRLLCGDATSQADYDRLLQGHKADLIFTDPPYNVNYKGTKYAPILNDDLSEEGFITFVETWMARFKDALKPGGVFYICSGYVSYPAFAYAIKKTGMTFAGIILWIKNYGGWGWSDYRHQHEMVLKGRNKRKRAEPVIYGWNGGRHYFFESRLETDVWELPKRATADMLHPTQKPLAMVERAIKNSSRPGEIVLDPFAGSGSTLIAAERQGRTARAAELDPLYVDVIIRRYAAQGGATEAEIRATCERGETEGSQAGKAERSTREGYGWGVFRTDKDKDKAARKARKGARARSAEAPLRAEAQGDEEGGLHTVAKAAIPPRAKKKAAAAAGPSEAGQGIESHK